MTQQILEAWRINQRVHLRLIEKISDARMRCSLSRRGGRNVVPTRYGIWDWDRI